MSTKYYTVHLPTIFVVAMELIVSLKRPFCVATYLGTIPLTPNLTNPKPQSREAGELDIHFPPRRGVQPIVVLLKPQWK